MHPDRHHDSYADSHLLFFAYDEGFSKFVQGSVLPIEGELRDNARTFAYRMSVSWLVPPLQFRSGFAFPSRPFQIVLLFITQFWT
ncbi:hypothetical protein D3C81_1746450 [compost metagenome]